MPDRRTILNGNGIGDFVTIGNSFLYVDSIEKTPIYKINYIDIENEYARFKKALEKSQKEIEELKEQVDSDMKNILSTHILMLKDPVILKQVRDDLESKLFNIEHIYEEVISFYISKIFSINNKFLSDRISDIIDVKSRVIKNLLNPTFNNNSYSYNDSIVISKILTPSDVLNFYNLGVNGFVVESGGYTSHAAILAKSFGIPIIFNINDISSRIKNERKVIIDCKNDRVIINPDDSEIEKYTSLCNDFKKEKEKERLDASTRAFTKDDIEVKVHVNLDVPEEIENILKFNIDSVGLYRSEFLYLFAKDKEVLPSEEKQFNIYKNIALNIKDYSVIRTFDLGGDKMPSLSGLMEHKEDNPFLGWRAIRFCLSNIDIFTQQLRAILRASAFGKLKIIIPMISTIDELLEAKDIIENVKLELKSKNIKFDENIEIGALIETPSAATIIDVIIEEVDFISIGSNDLVQYMLACDRTNEKLTYLYNPIDLSVLRMLKHVISVAKINNKPVTLCGEMAGMELYIPVLLGLGIRDMSMSINSISKIKNIIKNVYIEDCEKLVSDMLDKKNNSYSKEILNSYFETIKK